jgi:nucleoside-diphosphate-sugar epimerase
MKTVIVIGSDGYIGHALILRLLSTGYRVIAVDDFQRRKHVDEMNSFSAIPIQSPKVRYNIFNQIGNCVFKKIKIHKQKLDILKNYNPVAIVNLAQQPSAPYSHKSKNHAISTTINNLIGTINVLYFIKNNVPDTHLVQIGSMGEYDHTIETEIPEGLFDLKINKKIIPDIIFPRRPGSIYHASKVAATYYIDAATRWWNIAATDIMQGVVYGNWTPEIEKYNCPTRLDSDEAFGTVINRFIVQAVIKKPLTIYGKGLHKRGYIPLADSVQALMLAIENPPCKGQYQTWNQISEIYSISDIAKKVRYVSKNKFNIDIKFKRIKSPRVENTSNFSYQVTSNKLKSLGFKQTRKISDEIEYSIKKILPDSSYLQKLSNVVNPKITWK